MIGPLAIAAGFVCTVLLLLPFVLGPLWVVRTGLVDDPAYASGLLGILRSPSPGVLLQAALIYVLPLACLYCTLGACIVVGDRVAGRRSRCATVPVFVALAAALPFSFHGGPAVGALLAGGVAATQVAVCLAASRQSAGLDLAQRRSTARRLLFCVAAWNGPLILCFVLAPRHLPADAFLSARDLIWLGRLRWLTPVLNSYYEATPYLTAFFDHLPAAGSSSLSPLGLEPRDSLTVLVGIAWACVGLVTIPMLGLAVWNGIASRNLPAATAGWVILITAVGPALATAAVVAAVHGSRSTGLTQASALPERYLTARRLARIHAGRLSAAQQAVLRDQALSHPQSCLRYWALAAIARQDVDDAVVILTSALRDPSPLVAAAALRALPPDHPPALSSSRDILADPSAHPYLQVIAYNYLRTHEMSPAGWRGPPTCCRAPFNPNPSVVLPETRRLPHFHRPGDRLFTDRRAQLFQFGRHRRA